MIGCSQLAPHPDPCLGHRTLVSLDHFILAEDLVRGVVLHFDVAFNFIENLIIRIFGELNLGLHLVVSTFGSEICQKIS